MKRTAHGYTQQVLSLGNRNTGRPNTRTYFPQAYAKAPGQRLERRTAMACWEVRLEEIFELHGAVLKISLKTQIQKWTILIDFEE